MKTAKLTSKGQLTVPKEIRDKLGISPGEELVFEEKDGLFYIKKNPRKSPFDKWAGYLKAGKKKKTDKVIEELRGK
jgi:AbrB family looped-hinge helix DNA binding protein